MMGGRLKKSWVLVGTVLAIAVVIPTMVLAVLAPWAGDAVAEEQRESAAAEGELKSLPSVPDAEVQAAPAETGGEPFRTCEGCHADFESKPDPTGDLIFSHPVHIDQNIKCATCHEPPLGHFSAPAPMMMTCLSCHEGETAPNDCKNCHRKLDEIAPGIDEPVVHLQPDAKARKTCEKCHEVETWCEQCHGVEMPHPADWQAAHTRAAAESAQSCEKCHQSKDKTFCISCHGVEMPHPAFWYSGHGDVARDNSQSCERCHPDSPEFCNDCHHAGFPEVETWESAHGNSVVERGLDGCFVCHEESFCEECHSTGRYVKQ